MVNNLKHHAQNKTIHSLSDFLIWVFILAQLKVDQALRMIEKLIHTRHELRHKLSQTYYSVLATLRLLIYLRLVILILRFSKSEFRKEMLIRD